MSDYYLCDSCENRLDGDHLNSCECLPYMHEHRKRVMHDHHGEGGIRYLDPLDVCPHYERKADA